MSTTRAVHGLSPVFALVLTAALHAQEAPPPTLTVSYTHDTGWVENRGSRALVTISFTVHQPQAEWMRIYFDEVHLGRNPGSPGQGSLLRITSHEDGGTQELSMTNVDQWQLSSAYFNGDAVQVDVLADPGTSSRIVMRALDMGLAPVDDPSQCGSSDDRTPSTDPRGARLLPVGCTGWLINDCQHCMLTAGHCTGSLSVAEFNVPMSNPNGSLNHPGPEDQYAVDSTSLQTNGGQGVGDDWGYFGTFPNSTTGMTAFESQGAAFDLANPPGASGNDIRITGYGVDNGTRNQVQQTHVGPMVVSSGSTVGYVTDTQGGNSGSPVIWEQTGEAVGIHTHGGCSSSGGNNWGTGANHSGLQSALAEPRGVCALTIYSDGFESGDYTAGGWVRKNNRPRIRTAASFSGTWGARLRRVTWIERAVDTTGIAGVALSYACRTQNYASGEVLKVQWWDGSSWSTVDTISNSSWSQQFIQLPPAAGNNPNFKLRFKTNSHVKKGRADVDDVRVSGCD